MKRSFHELDTAISADLWAKFPREKKHVVSAGALEKKVDLLLNDRFRASFGCNSEAKVVSKCVRVVMRHEFLPKVEGQVVYHAIYTHY
jgi:hypothetical protein